MIQHGTFLNVADNSGASQVQCIKVLGGSRKKIATIGDTIVVTVKQIRRKGRIDSKSKMKRGTVSKAIVVRVKKEFVRHDGSLLQFDDNAVLLTNNQGAPLGTRIFGPLPNELRLKKNTKMISLAPNLV